MFERLLGTVFSFIEEHSSVWAIAILIAIICVILFWPIKYEVIGKYTDNLYLKARITWLFSLFGLDARKNGGWRVWTHIGPKKRMIYSSKVEEEKEKTKKDSPKKEAESDVSEEDETSENKISDNLEKVKKVFAFLKEDENREYIKYVIRKTLWFIQRVAPKTAVVKGRYCLGAPDVTGLVTGGISLIPIVYMYDIAMIPDFESEDAYVKATFSVHGQLRGITIIRYWLWVFTKKQTRQIMNYIRNS